jgi:hypothetical protein
MPGLAFGGSTDRFAPPPRSLCLRYDTDRCPVASCLRIDQPQVVDRTPSLKQQGPRAAEMPPMRRPHSAKFLALEDTLRQHRQPTPVAAAAPRHPNGLLEPQRRPSSSQRRRPSSGFGFSSRQRPSSAASDSMDASAALGTSMVSTASQRRATTTFLQERSLPADSIFGTLRAATGKHSRGLALRCGTGDLLAARRRPAYYLTAEHHMNDSFLTTSFNRRVRTNMKVVPAAQLM